VKTEDLFKDYSWRRVTYWDGAEDVTKTFDNKLKSLIFQANRAPMLNSAYGRGEEVIVRHRMSKEIAEELLIDMGDSAFVYCLERIENNELTQNSRLWREVLLWLGEESTKGESNERI